MVVWINGAFGAGKTSVAAALARRWPEAIVFDPEQVGIMLRRVVPTTLQPADFQDLAAWRRLTVETALTLLASFERPLVVPMTLIEPAYFDEVIGGLRARGVDVHHFTLAVSAAVLRRRIRRRFARPAARRFALAHVDRSVEALRDARFRIHLDGETAGVDEVVEALVRHLPVPLAAVR